METLARHFRDLTRAAFAKHGFAYGELLAQWPELIGRDLAQYCEPERLRWPRGQEKSTQKLGGVLTVRAMPGRALDISYDAPRIIDRINSFYGYAAISELKVIPGPMTKPAPRAKHEASPFALYGPAHDLESALSRLGAAVEAQRVTQSPDPNAQRHENSNSTPSGYLT